MMHNLNQNSTIEDLSQVVPSDQGIQRRSWEGGTVKGFLELGEGWVECEDKEAEENGLPSLIVRYRLSWPGRSSWCPQKVTDSSQKVPGGSAVGYCAWVLQTWLFAVEDSNVCVYARSVVFDSLWPPQTVVCQAPLLMGVSWHKY